MSLYDSGVSGDQNESESRSRTIDAEGCYVRLESNLDFPRQIAVGSRVIFYGPRVALSNYGGECG